MQLLFVQPAADTHVRGQAVSRFFGVGMEQLRRIIVMTVLITVIIIVTNCAATASKPALFVAPAHVAIQTVLYKVGAFKFGEFHRRDHKHAHDHGGQW